MATDDHARAAPVRLAAGYLATQAALGVLWWAALVFVPAARRTFELGSDHDVLDAFSLADATIFIGGSAVSAWAIWTHRPWSVLAVSFTAGGTAYATLFLARWVLTGGAGSVGLLPMIAATAATVTAARVVWRERP